MHAGEAIAGTVRAKGRVRIRVRRTSVWRGGASAADASLDQHTDGVVVIGDATFTLPGLRGPLLTSSRGVNDLTLDVAPSRLRAGEELVATVAFTTKEEVVVESIAIQLAEREHGYFRRV